MRVCIVSDVAGERRGTDMEDVSETELDRDWDMSLEVSSSSVLVLETGRWQRMPDVIRTRSRKRTERDVGLVGDSGASVTLTLGTPWLVSSVMALEGGVVSSDS